MARAIVSPFDNLSFVIAARNLLTLVVAIRKLPSIKQGRSLRIYTANIYTIPPKVTGSLGTIKSWISRSARKKAAYFSILFRLPEVLRSTSGIPASTHSTAMLLFIKTETLVTARIRSFVRGSSLIYTTPAFSKCFFISFFPISPPMIAQTSVPIIIAGIAHQVAPIE